MTTVGDPQGSAATLLLHDLFEESARRWPSAIAIDVPPGVSRPQRSAVTYAELKQRSDALACRLRSFVAGECLIAILLSRGSETLYSAQLAVLKAGAAYVCIDPAFPDAQIREIIADSGTVALLTDRAGLARAAQARFAVSEQIDVEECIHQTARGIAPPNPHWLTPDSLAYLIYTSGTTGRPKGVMIAHRSIVNLVRSDLDEFALVPEDRVAQGSSAAYDSSVEETWLALASGAAVVPMDDDAARLGPDLIPWLRGERITVLCPPPTLLRATGCEHPEKALPDLRLLYVGGEALPRDVADRWAWGRRMVNGYGPTECTVTATRADILPTEPITIGRPVPGMQAWVLDSCLDPVPDGEPGELCLGGAGLALGYHNRPELTLQKFPVHPEFGRIYRTGDLVHKLPDDALVYHGRIDSQVKLRGYRIELEAIEVCLAECSGVREAACRLQGEGTQQTLAAFIVPVDTTEPPPFAELKTALSRTLPAYMVPTLFGLLSELPKTVGGKVKRDDLPELEVCSRNRGRIIRQPRSVVECQVAAAVCDILRLQDGLSIDDDFFTDLGGSSLLAAQVISRLRDDPMTASLTVRDLYEARTVADLARRAAPPRTTSLSEERLRSTPLGSTVRATLLQATWLFLELMVGASTAYFATGDGIPWLLHRLGLIPLVLLAAPLLFVALAAYTLFAVTAAVGAKRLLIGRYRPQRVPVWSGLYVRHWIVQRMVRLAPWQLLTGTEFQNMALRALGARIGRRVHIHRGVDLFHGGWDLLDIGDDVTIGQDATIRLVDLEDGHLVVGPISLGRGATLEVRSGLGPHTALEPAAYLTALSSLPTGGCIPEGERWEGIPAQPAGRAPCTPPLPANQKALTPVAHGLALILAQSVLWSALALPIELLIAVCILRFDLIPESIVQTLSRPASAAAMLLAMGLLVMVSLLLSLAFEALAARFLGCVPEGHISRWSLAYIRVWLKASLVDSASEWLSGTLFWPIWLRWAGMKVGANCEISTIIDVVPELIEIGPETFLADGIYLGGPRIHRGTVTLAKATLAKNTFLGNHVVIPGGQHLPENILLGVCTVADERVFRSNSSWFGQPPFELPRREVLECDRRLTHQPTPLRYLDRLFWECLRFTLPTIPLLLLFGWLEAVADAAAALPAPLLLGAALPLITLAFLALPCALVLVLKWMLLGRVRPGTHPLWSCWCSRWDFLYVAWGELAHGILSALEGTEMLIWYLHAMGMKLGKRVVLGSGFSQVVDPDMLEIEDGATVSAMFQAHTFEDRVLKIDRVHIGKQATLASGTVPLYGADIGAHTYVAPHSVIMKGERLLPGLRYEGAPTKPQSESPIRAEISHEVTLV